MEQTIAGEDVKEKSAASRLRQKAEVGNTK